MLIARHAVLGLAATHLNATAAKEWISIICDGQVARQHSHRLDYAIASFKKKYRKTSYARVTKAGPSRKGLENETKIYIHAACLRDEKCLKQAAEVEDPKKAIWIKIQNKNMARDYQQITSRNYRRILKLLGEDENLFASDNEV